MEPFRGKASGKTPAHEITMHGYDPMEHPYVLAQAERIAELEAEVERVSDYARDLESEIKACPNSFHPIYYRGRRKPGVNPSGDTLGRKERDDG